MRKTRFVLFFCLLDLAAAACFAGDSAVFANLGFSEKGDYFMFAQYGVSSFPYAESYIVDAARNSFVKDGTAVKTYKETLLPGQDPAGALYALLGEQARPIAKYGIDHIRQGRLLYLSMNGDDAKTTLEFRDFATKNAYSVTLNQKIEKNDAKPASSFGIQIKRTSSSGAETTLNAGNPKIVREGVKGYAIRKILASPNDRFIVFVIEKQIAESTGTSIRYMVETLALN
jgi:predicted secreted protein